MPTARDDLLAAAAAAQRADEALHDAVRAARAAGMSWQEVGDLLGTSRQAAHQRFRGHDDGRSAGSSAPVAPETVARSTLEALLAGDVHGVRRALTSTARRTLTADLLGDLADDVTEVLGPGPRIGPTRRHRTDGAVVPDRTVPDGQAVVVRAEVSAGALPSSEEPAGHLAPLVAHVLVGRTGRVAGLSLRAVAHESWPL